jgi:hypothetical protein
MSSTSHDSGMATLSNPTLSFTPIPNNPAAVLVRATVDVTFTATELLLLANGLVLKVNCALVEEDIGGTDDPLFVFTRKRTTTSETVEFKTQILKESLDEEGGPDEIYARFSLRMRGIPAPITSSRVVVDY